MTTKKTNKWQMVVSAFCAVLILAAVVVFPMQAKAYTEPISAVTTITSATTLTMAPGSTAVVSVWGFYRVGVGDSDDVMVGPDSNKAHSWGLSVYTDPGGGIYTQNVTITAPPAAGVYKLWGWTYTDRMGGGGMYPTDNSIIVTVTSGSAPPPAAPAVPAGKIDSTEFWMGKHYEMYYSTAKLVRANADEQNYDYVPHYIFDYLTANPSMTLRVQYKGEAYMLNDKNMQKYGVLPGLNYLFSSLTGMGF